MIHSWCSSLDAKILNLFDSFLFFLNDFFCLQQEHLKKAFLHVNDDSYHEKAIFLLFHIFYVMIGMIYVVSKYNTFSISFNIHLEIIRIY